MKGAGVRSTNNTGIWSNGKLVARTGAAAPGGGIFAQLENPVSNRWDHVAFQATLSNGVRGIWWSRGGVCVPVTSNLMQAPGCNGAYFQSFSSLVLPDDGGPVFRAELVIGPGGVSAANRVGLWAVDGSGQLRLIARQGERRDSHGQPRFVVSGPEFVGKPRSYNSIGNIIYKETLDDGSQVLYRAKYQSQ